MKAIALGKVGLQTLHQFMPESEQLPVYIHGGTNRGQITTCYELSQEEIDSIVETGKIWLTQLSYVPGAVISPVLKSCLRPEGL